MVAKIDTNDRLDKTLNYNEQKVAQEEAVLIMVSGFLKEKERLNFHEKMERLERNNALNEKSEVNTLHAKISFDPSEKEKLSNEKLARIAERYMEGIGFKDQPYLVYRHLDTDVPHIHIVSTMIQADGKRIRDYKIGEEKSEPTRKAIEQEFGLVRAQDHAMKEEYKLKPVDAEKIQYGEKPTKRAIENNLQAILKEWKVTSLSELNAVLRPLNMTADRGEPGSRIREHHGLVYKAVDAEGKTVGIPINASDISFKPTLANLEPTFEGNKKNREQELSDLRAKIDVAFALKPKNMEALVDLLQKEKVDMMVWRGDEGRIYGLTYVDYDLKIAAKGSDVGKEYSASAIERRMQELLQDNTLFLTTVKGQKQEAPNPGEQIPENERSRAPIPTPTREERDRTDDFSNRAIVNQPAFESKIPELLSGLMKSETGGEDLPKELKRDKRRRRGKEL